MRSLILSPVEGAKDIMLRTDFSLSRNDIDHERRRVVVFTRLAYDVPGIRVYSEPIPANWGPSDRGDNPLARNALLQAASQMKPDGCVVDISMPIMSGIEAVTQMKASGLSVNVVFLTVREDPDFLEAALATGALGYVVK